MDTNLWNILFSEVNIILTLLLSLLIIYWLITMIGGIDFDLDFDVEVDVDIDADVDIDTGLEGGNMDFQDVSNVEVDKDHVIGKRQRKLKWWQVFLIYFNFVGLPFMFTFTCWIFIWWTITTLTTALTFTYDNYLGFVIMIAGFFPALILNKLFTSPFKSFFKNLNKDGDAPVDYLGRKGVLLSTISEDKMGNAEILADGNPMAIYVKSLDGTPITYGSEILIIKRSSDKHSYLVQLYNETN
ncbi:MAG: hypothetical protein WBG71_14945 [Leeuwenhoekiella sp.]